MCDLVAAGLVKSEKVPDLVGAIRDNHVYVTLFLACYWENPRGRTLRSTIVIVNHAHKPSTLRSTT